MKMANSNWSEFSTTVARKPKVQAPPPRSFRKLAWSTGAVALIALGITAYTQRQKWSMFWHRLPLSSDAKKVPQPDRQSWELLRNDLKRWRPHYAQKYRAARSSSEKHAVLAEVRGLLEHNLPELMRCWLGTPWDFNGTASEPGGGKIACGYFVSTVLQGADFQISRNQLAQQASQNILLTFLKEQDLRLRVGVPYKTFSAETQRCEPGIYIVGLDTHVGFLIVKDQTFQFIHSSGSQPWCVVEENPEQAKVLERSNYRVLGNITGSDDVLRRWLLGDTFVTHR